MSFKDISFLALAAFFAQLSRTDCAVLVEGIMRNISVKLNLDQWLRMVSFKDISIFEYNQFPNDATYKT